MAHLLLTNYTSTAAPPTERAESSSRQLPINNNVNSARFERVARDATNKARIASGVSPSKTVPASKRAMAPKSRIALNPSSAGNLQDKKKHLIELFKSTEVRGNVQLTLRNCRQARSEGQQASVRVARGAMRKLEVTRPSEETRSLQQCVKSVKIVNSECSEESDSAISCESVKLCESDEVMSDEDLKRMQDLEHRRKEIAAEMEEVTKEEKLIRELRTNSPEEVLQTLHQECEVLRAERSFRAAIDSGNEQVILKTIEEIKTLVTRKRQESRKPTEDEKAALRRLADILDKRQDARKNGRKTSGKKSSMEHIRQQLLQEEIEERRKEKERKEEQQQEEKKRQEEEERKKKMEEVKRVWDEKKKEMDERRQEQEERIRREVERRQEEGRRKMGEYEKVQEKEEQKRKEEERREQARRKLELEERQQERDRQARERREHQKRIKEAEEKEKQETELKKEILEDWDVEKLQDRIAQLIVRRNQQEQTEESREDNRQWKQERHTEGTERNKKSRQLGNSYRCKNCRSRTHQTEKCSRPSTTLLKAVAAASGVSLQVKRVADPNSKRTLKKMLREMKSQVPPPPPMLQEI